MAWYNGTDLEYNNSSVEGLYSTYFQCLQWIFRGKVVEPTMAGRKIPLGKTITYYGPRGLIYETGVNLKEIGRHQEEVEAVLHRFNNVLPDSQYALVGHRHFFNTDLSVQQRREYYASVRILSNRTVRPESWSSGENIKGFFQADGFMTVLIDGKEFGKLENEVFQVYDWARVPSVTNQYTNDIPGYHLNSYNSRRFFNDAKFSGGVTDGFIGLASMVYNRPYVPLHAFKSWFFFNDVIVVVGSGITLEEAHRNQHDVSTTLTQIVFKGKYIVCTNTGEEMTLGLDSKDYKKPSWMFHRRVGYVFLNGDEHLHSVAETRKNGDKTLDVFMAWTTHSTYPVNATVAYAVLPSVTLKGIRKFFSKPTVEVITNETNKHVVCHHPSIAVGASLPEGGRVTVASCGARGPWEIEVDIPCLVLVTLEESSRVEEDKIALSVSDPQQMYDVINVSISFEGRHAETMIQLPKDPLRGSSNTTVIKL